MPVITIFSGSYCNAQQVVEETRSRTGYGLIADTEIVTEASRLSSIPANRIERVFSDKTSVFNRLTRERERSLAHLRAALAKSLSADNLIITGFAGQLIPRDIDHVVRVCLIADMKSRIAAATGEHRIAEPEALKIIHREDENCAAWMHMLFAVKDPWHASLYDIVFPTDKLSPDEITRTIQKNIAKSIVKPAGRSRMAVADFQIAADVEIALIKAGHTVGVDVQGGVVTLTINKHVLMLNRLEEELKAITGRVAGVASVETKVGPGYYQTDVYRRQDFEAPSKILLVDDEKKYVQTLSKRLMMRELDSAVVYDGESALELAREDEPDVMILDLRMPGIDGIEVLRRVKKTRPAIEVIVLTSQGSEADKKTCMELGAFAFLSKSVDIDELSRTIKAAHEKIRRTRAEQAPTQTDH
ncbi:response regulator [Desulfosarcina sp.]|uniref:response regulator n=1 Tax=Desulfosarcina sp. TaxID=2027861 RepID=UPI003970B248